MFQITGILREITVPVSGTSAQGKPWQRCTAIVEAQEGEFVTVYAVNAFNKEITIPVGSTVTVDFYVQSRCYNGNWYVGLNLRNIELAVQQPTYQPPAQPQYTMQGYQQPMQQQAYRQPLPQTPVQPIRPTAPAPQTQYQQPQMPPAPQRPVSSDPVEEATDLPF